MKNVDIRILLKANGVRQFEVAEALGVSESYFSRLLRDDLSESNREKILAAVEKIIEERGK